MYLLIFEDGSIKKTNEITEDDKNSSEDGYVDIIDISNQNEPKYFFVGEWKLIPTSKEYDVQ